MKIDFIKKVDLIKNLFKRKPNLLKEKKMICLEKLT